MKTSNNEEYFEAQMKVTVEKLDAALDEIKRLRAEVEELRQSAADDEETITAAANELRRLRAELAEAKETLQFVERWANHHGAKPTCSAEAALSCIQHYPPIVAITRSYTDGRLPDTPNPWAEVDKLAKQLGDLTTIRKQDELVHGNIMGRIAVNLFGKQNNVTDEECVAETASIGYRQTALMQRLKGLEEELHVWQERYQRMLEWAAQLKAYEPPAPIVVDANSPMLGVLRGAKDAAD